MRTLIRHGRGAAVALVAALAFGAACADAVQPQPPRAEDPIAALGPGIHPVVVVSSRGPTTAQVELHLKQVEMNTPIASFQGELTYDAAKLTLNGGSLPEGIMGAWNEVSPGKVRFAGASVDGVRSGPVLVLRFSTRAQVTAQAFGIRMDEVVGAAGFTDLTSRVSAAPRPVFVEGGLAE